MTMTNREYTLEYYDPSADQDGTYDVSFELTEEAEDVLFKELAHEISDEIHKGAFPDQLLHLFKRLSDQRGLHPPWIEVRSDKRVYDLEITEWEYHLLSSAIGDSVSNVLSHEAAEKYKTLLDAWQSITEQMSEADVGVDSDQEQLDSYENGGEDRETFNCTVDDGDFEFHSGDNHMWYVCTTCNRTFDSRENHTCEGDGK